MRSFEFNLALPPDKTLAIYEGRARYILVESDQGLKLQLPAANFRQYVDDSGINGRFHVHIDAANRILDLTRVR